jgi:hypothetical protein
MAAPIRKLTRLALYVFFLSLTALLSTLLGGKKSDTSNGQTSLIPSTPIAQADSANCINSPWLCSGDQGPDSGDGGY